MKNLLTATALAVSLVAGAAAANAAGTPTTSDTKVPAYAAPVVDDANAMKGADMVQHTSLRQQLMNQLEKAGYTQVKVTPSSFFVEAKDKKGDAVAMVIGPDSFAEVTNVPMKTPGPTAQQAPAANTQQK
jgi:hypothetical protein